MNGRRRVVGLKQFTAERQKKIPRGFFLHKMTKQKQSFLPASTIVQVKKCQLSDFPIMKLNLKTFFPSFSFRFEKEKKFYQKSKIFRVQQTFLPCQLTQKVFANFHEIFVNIFSKKLLLENPKNARVAVEKRLHYP